MKGIFIKDPVQRVVEVLKAAGSTFQRFASVKCMGSGKKVSVKVQVGNKSFCTDERNGVYPIIVSIQKDWIADFTIPQIKYEIAPYLLHHEVAHALHTNDAFKDAIMQGVDALNDIAKKEGIVLHQRAIKSICHSVVNSVEDGRIERIEALSNEGFDETRILFRLYLWKQFEGPYSEEPEAAEQLVEFMNNILTLSTLYRLKPGSDRVSTGVLTKGWLKCRRGTEEHMLVKKMKPIIRKAINADQCEDIVKPCVTLLKMLYPYIKECCELKVITRELADLLEKVLQECLNSEENNGMCVPSGSGSSSGGMGSSEAGTSGSGSSTEGEETSEEETSGSNGSTEGEETSEEETSGSGSSTEGEETSEKETSGSNGSTEGEDASEEETSGSNGSTEGEETSEEETSGSNGSTEGEEISEEETSGSGSSTEGEETSEEETSGSNGSTEGEETSEEETSGSNGSTEGEETSEEETSGSNGSTEGEETSEEETSGSESSTEGEETSEEETSGSNGSTEGEDATEEETSGSNGSIEGEDSSEEDEDLEEGNMQNDASLDSEFQDKYSKSQEHCGQEMKRDSKSLAESLYGNYDDSDMYDFLEIVPDMSKKSSIFPELKGEANILKRFFENYIRNKSTPNLVNQKRGKLNTRQLTKVAIGQSNYFKKTGEPWEPSLAVYLLKDNSGSMGGGQGSKHEESCKALSIIEEALPSNISLKICSFFTAGYHGNWAVVHHMIKDWGDVSGSTNYSATYYQSNPISAGGNKDGYDIRVATHDLQGRPEEKKILIVLSDGQPSDYEKGEAAAYLDVKNAVAEARKSNIEVVSLFFGSDDFIQKSEEFYRLMYEKNYIGCNPENIGKELSKVLKKVFR